MALEPITRAEKIMSGKSLEPITREEMFLAKAAGMDVSTPEPITRMEMFLSKISGGTGGGGDVSSGEVVFVPLTTFTTDDDWTPYTGIEIPDDIVSAYHSVGYAVYFDGKLYDEAKLHVNGKYGNPSFWFGTDDGTPFLLVAGEGIYAYAGTHTIRIIKIP